MSMLLLNVVIVIGIMFKCMRQMFSGDDERKYRVQGENKQPGVVVPGVKCEFEESDKAINAYKWKDEDFLLTAYMKNGTHFMWEIMMMLIRGNSEYIRDSKVMTMIEAFPCTKYGETMPGPKVLNTHYRLDCLPEEFHGRKTVFVIRNPKDTLVSYYHHHKGIMQELLKRGAVPDQFREWIENFAFSDFVQEMITDKEIDYGTHLDYLESMWKHRHSPNLHIVNFEDLKMHPRECITKLNEFMDTNCSPELIADIVDKTSFQKMKIGKVESETRARDVLFIKNEGETTPALNWSIYRRGDVGDWKNHFTVAENEAFDKMMKEWQEGKDIPFIYE